MILLWVHLGDTTYCWRGRERERILSFHWIEFQGKGLGPVHRSTGPVEMLPRVQKLYKTGHVAAFQRTQATPEFQYIVSGVLISLINND